LKKNTQRSIEKCAPIKEHRKREKESMTPSKIKATRESQSKQYLEKQTKIFHTLAHLYQVA
jgi:hypothetical protein